MVPALASKLEQFSAFVARVQTILLERRDPCFQLRDRTIEGVGCGGVVLGGAEEMAHLLELTRSSGPLFMHPVKEPLIEEAMAIEDFDEGEGEGVERRSGGERRSECGIGDTDELMELLR